METETVLISRRSLIIQISNHLNKDLDKNVY